MQEEARKPTRRQPAQGPLATGPARMDALVRNNDTPKLELSWLRPGCDSSGAATADTAHHPKVVFLSETHQNKSYVESLRWRLGLKHVVTFSGQGKGCGLALF